MAAFDPAARAVRGGQVTALGFEVEIWREAIELVDAHGADACLEVAMLADRCLDAGDLDGQRKWLQVLTAVEWLVGTEGAHPFRVSH